MNLRPIILIVTLIPILAGCNQNSQLVDRLNKLEQDVAKLQSENDRQAASQNTQIGMSFYGRWYATNPKPHTDSYGISAIDGTIQIARYFVDSRGELSRSGWDYSEIQHSQDGVITAIQEAGQEMEEHLTFRLMPDNTMQVEVRDTPDMELDSVDTFSRTASKKLTVD